LKRDRAIKINPNYVEEDPFASDEDELAFFSVLGKRKRFLEEEIA
jgi:hypothetical protein